MKFLSFRKIKKIVKRLGIKSSAEWFRWARSSARPLNIPIVPYYTYKEWINWYDFLGKDNKIFLSYNDAQEIAIKNKIMNSGQWEVFIKNSSHYLPRNPAAVYKNKGWIDWKTFLNKHRNMEKYHVNHNFFKKWSYDMAYILGFWWADGCIVKNTNTFDIAQHIKDKDLLIDMFDIMGSNYPLAVSDNIVRIRVSSPQICKDIYKLGGTSNKSLTIKMPNIPKKYLPDFIRGYFDGDGSIYLDRQHNRYRSDFTSGSKIFIYGLQRILRKEIPLFKGYVRRLVLEKGYKIKNRIVNKKTVYYRLCMGTNDTIRLRKFMYPKGKKYLKLKRKYDRFVLAGDINLIWNRNREIWPFHKAKKYVHKLNFKTGKQWIEYCKSNKKPLFLPSRPNIFYKNKGWKNVRDWVGNYKL